MAAKNHRVLIWCLPALIFLSIGIFGFGLILNRTTFPTFVMLLVLGLIITRVLFLLLSGKKPGAKLFLAVLWLVIFALLLSSSIYMPWMLHRSTKKDAVSRFKAGVADLTQAADFDSLDVGPVRSVEYHSFVNHVLFFTSEACTLICNYDETEYAKALAMVEDRYDFRTKQLETGRFNDKHSKIVIDPQAAIGDDRFRFVLPGDYNSEPFYKECLLIMNNDEKRQIAYIAFSDSDLDIADDLEKFLNEYCGWRYVQ